MSLLPPFGRRAPILIVAVSALALSSGSVLAGSYSQAFAFADGTPAIGGGTELSTSNTANPAVASVQGGALRLVQAGVYNTVSAFKLPDLDPGMELSAFDISFRVRMTQNGAETPADGFSINFGPIPAGQGGGPLGFAMREGLAIGWDTYNNGGDPPSIEVFYDGVSIANATRTFAYSTSYTTATIHWDSTAGLDVSYNGTVVTDLPVPAGFPKGGYTFAFSAYTGGLSQDVYIDDLAITTTPNALIETGGPVISEFVADNTKREDSETETPDWIEIYNGQAGSASLDGWFLTDDAGQLAKWRIPAVTMAPYSYLVVSASGKDRANPAAELHTNFRLDNEGGYLALVRPDNTVAGSYNYLAQVKDVSYGELGSARTRGYMEKPSPGSRNQAPHAARPPAEDVVWSRDGGLITAATQVSVTVPPGAVVRYTINGTVPTAASAAYSAPLNVTTSLTLRARTFRTDFLPGPVSSRTLLLLDSSLTNFNGSGQPFSSNLPVLVFDSFGTSVDSITDPNSPRPFRLAYAVALDRNPATGRTGITGTPDFQGRSGIHVRGESSSGFPQRSYAWETWDNDGNDKDVSVLGLPSESDWVLHGPWSDKTLMRNYLVYSTFGESAEGYFAPRTKFVEVFLNPELGQPVSYSDYRGIYLLVEKPKQGKNRADVAKTNPLVTDPLLAEGGYVFKHDKNAPGSTQWNTATFNQFMEGHDPEALNTAQFNYLRGYLNNYEAALNGGGFTDPVTGYRAWIDQRTFIDAQWAVEISKQVDGYVFSTYFNKDRGGKIKAGPLWDFNISLGNADYATGDTPAGWLYDTAGTATGTGGLWYPRLHQDPEYRLAHFDRYWQLRRSLWTNAAITARIDGTASMLMDGNTSTMVTNNAPVSLQNPAARHYRKYQILGQRQWPNPASATSLTTYQAEVNAMKTWVNTRLNWLDDQLYSGTTVLRPPVFSHGGGIVSTPFALTISPYTGTPPAGKTYTGGTIYYTLDGTDPRTPALPSVSRLLVPENAPCRVLVPNADIGASWRNVSYTDSAWLAGTQGVGYDDAPDYNPFIGTNLEAPNPVMKGVNQTCYIRIPFNVTAAQLEGVNFLKLKIRRDDGFIAYLNGTKIAEHYAPASPTWNSAATPAAFDEAIAKTLAEFDCTTNLNALVEGPNMLAIHGLNFGINSSDFLCQAVLETGVRSGIPGAPSASATAYTSPLSLDTSATVKARVYDAAAGTWTPITEASFIVDAVPASAENIVVSEMNYHPADPSPVEIAAGFTASNNFEYVELLNIGASAVDLTGAAFTAGIGFEFTSSFAPSILRLGPGERVVVAENPEAFALRYGISAGLKLAGPYSGNLANGGEPLTLSDKNGADIKSFTYSDAEPWPVDADGAGYSLVLHNPPANPDHGLPGSWRSSGQIGGTPGSANGTIFTGNPVADDDNDGLAALVEHALGLDPALPNGSPVVTAGEQEFIVDNVASPYLVIRFRRSLLADAVNLVPELSPTMAPGSFQASALIYVSTENNGDGSATVTYRSVQPAATITRAFVRLRAE